MTIKTNLSKSKEEWDAYYLGFQEKPFFSMDENLQSAYDEGALIRSNPYQEEEL